MRGAFDVSIVSPDKTVVDEVTDLLVAPGREGYFGILIGHEPMLVALKTGVLVYKDASGEPKKVAVSGGFLETDGKKVIVLADAAEHSDQIDIKRALAAFERAKARLNEKSEDVSLERATASLERASNRLKLTGN